MKKSYQLRNPFLLLQAATPVLSVLVGSLALALAVTAKAYRVLLLAPACCCQLPATLSRPPM